MKFLWMVLLIMPRGQVLADMLDEPIDPIPLQVTLDLKKVNLGKTLFNDPRLSRNNTVSCATCHDLTSHGGADRLKVSIGIDGTAGHINTPTVLNSSLNFVQFWDGRAATLHEQIDGPISNFEEMDSNWTDIVDKLSKDSVFTAAAYRTYAKPLSAELIKDAIANFEKSLITPNSRFDLYLRGNQKILTPAELAGYRNFKEFGCAACHQGVNVGGNMYQKMGAMDDYFKDQSARRVLTKSDNGRFNITGLEEDRHVFRVPSLRNVALTPPYFHDGGAKTLEDAVRTMAKYQLGRTLKPEEVKNIVSFLKTLTGKILKIE